jgi:hypothetical protein
MAPQPPGCSSKSTLRALTEAANPRFRPFCPLASVREGCWRSSFADPLILKLASVTQQTPHARTLRLIMLKGRTLSFRPGQYPTFPFLFD